MEVIRCTLISLMCFTYVASYTHSTSTAFVGETTDISCLFGEGVVRNLYWTYWNGTKWTEVATLFRGYIYIGRQYSSNRISLNRDNYSLVVSDVRIFDEGRYQCDVDREDDTPIGNITAQLFVIARPAEPLPTIIECFHKNEIPCTLEYFNGTRANLTCALFRYYPASNASLEWREKDGRTLTPAFKKQTTNLDGTYTLMITIEAEIFNDEHYTCVASSYLILGPGIYDATVSVSISEPSANGGETHPSGTRNTIVIVAIVVISVFIIGVIGLLYVIRRKWGQCLTRRSEANRGSVQPGESARMTDLPENAPNKPDTSDKVQGETVATPLLEKESAGTAPNKPDTSDKVQGETVATPLLEKESAGTDIADETDGQSSALISTESATPEMVTDEQLVKLANLLPAEKYIDVCVKLRIPLNEAGNTLKNHHNDLKSAYLNVMQRWRGRTDGPKNELDQILKDAELGGLITKYL